MEYVPAKNHCALSDPSIRKRSVIACRTDRKHNAPAFTVAKSQSVGNFCEFTSLFLGSLDFSILLASAFFTVLLVHQKRYQVRSSNTGRACQRTLPILRNSADHLLYWFLDIRRCTRVSVHLQRNLHIPYR